jgi:hypothetical protein
MAHIVKHPERTAYRYLTMDIEYKVFRTREALAKCIRKQEERGHSHHDWSPVVSLGSGEGF